MDSKDEALEGLREEVVKCFGKVKEAEENTNLLTEACDEIEEKSDKIFEEYRDALATFRAEPEPLVKESGVRFQGY